MEEEVLNADIGEINFEKLDEENSE